MTVVIVRILNVQTVKYVSVVMPIQTILWMSFGEIREGARIMIVLDITQEKLSSLRYLLMQLDSISGRRTRG